MLATQLMCFNDIREYGANFYLDTCLSLLYKHAKTYNLNISPTFDLVTQLYNGELQVSQTHIV